MTEQAALLEQAVQEKARGGGPAYWELGDGAVVLRDGVLYALNATARAL